jgi:predicted aconitase with swiveling domain
MNPPFVVTGRTLVSGETNGKAVVLAEPLSLWGGFDLESGAVLDINHPQHGVVLSGRVLVMPGGRGSSSSSSILLESARRAIHPRAIILAEPDPILVIGALLAEDLYGVKLPLVLLSGDDLSRLRNDMSLTVRACENTASIQCDSSGIT